MIPFKNVRDSQGSETFLRAFSDSIYVVTLRDSATEFLAVPASARFCIINGSDYWVSSVADFTIPVSVGTIAITAEFEGPGYSFEPGAVANLYFKASINTALTVSFYK